MKVWKKCFKAKISMMITENLFPIGNDAWHHQMAYGIKDHKIYLTNYNVSSKQKFCEDDKEEKKLSLKCVHSLKKETVLIPLRYPYDSKRSVNLHHDTDIFIRITEKMIDEKEEKEIKNWLMSTIEDINRELYDKSCKDSKNIIKSPENRIKRDCLSASASSTRVW